MKIIKRISAAIVLSLVALFGSQTASAQYWEAANQLPSLISPALSGSGAYKGSVEVMGVAGLGNNKLNQVEIATSQGYQYNSWFYMGVGLGVSVAHVSDKDLWVADNGRSSYGVSNSKQTGVMIPVFSDFRLTIPTGGNNGGTSIFIDMRLGASWLCGNSYLDMTDGYLANNTMFYFRPAVGARIPINSQNSRQAVNIGLAYLLLTGNNSDYWYYRGNTPTLSALGATVSFEW